MIQPNGKALYSKKILLSMCIFAAVILTGKIIFSQFDILSLSFAEASAEEDLASILSPEFFHQKAMETGKQADQALILYRSDASKADVLWFFAHITGNETIARIILDNASRNNLAPSLAFALAWEESHYTPKAVNRNASSTDRGLFQLNNKAFPKLTEKDFFNPETNAEYGLAHLSYCIDLSGNEVAALAMYNAGTTKVSADKTPKRTLDYVSRIFSYKEGLEKLFNEQVASRYAVASDGTVTPAKR